MNWYKKAQNKQRGVSHPQIDYMDVGHKNFDTRQIDLWIFKDGDLEITRKVNERENHQGLWGETDNTPYYFGRFDHASKIASVSTPLRFRGRPIPSIILRALYDTFGGDIKIYEFA